MWRGIILSVFISVQVQAQIKNIILDEGGSAGFQLNKPGIAINPKDPNNIAAAAPNNVYLTKDGGKTWSKSQVSSPNGVYGDPVIISDKKGDFYFFHLSGPTGENGPSEESFDRIVCQKSEDGGVTWSVVSDLGHNPPKNQDKEWTISNRKGDIHVTWTQLDKYGSKNPEHESNILVATSKNGGKKWSEPIQLNAVAGDCLNNDNTVKGAMPAVLDDGKLFVTWAYNNSIYLDRSYDGGKLWLQNDLKIFEQPGGWNFKIPGLQQANGFPVLIADRSPTILNGMIYLNWSDQSNGTDDTDIWFSSSPNGGDSWDGKVRVNNDEPGNHQFLSWMAQDYTTGFIYIIYYDRRNYDDLRTDVYLAFSKNGGRSFHNLNISETAFIPDEDHFVGGYTNIAAYDGTIVPVWTRMDEGKTKMVTAVIKQEELDQLVARQ